MSSQVEFKEDHVKTFMGGTFDIGRPQMVSALRNALKDIDNELAQWDDNTEIAEVWLKGRFIQITLKHGIVL